MDLKQRAKAGLEERKAQGKKLDLDTFGEIMDQFIQESACALLIYKEENSDQWTVNGAGMGAMLDFYICLNALGPLFLEMLEEMGGPGAVEAEKLVQALGDMLTKALKAEGKAAAAAAEGGAEA